VREAFVTTLPAMSGNEDDDEWALQELIWMGDWMGTIAFMGNGAVPQIENWWEASRGSRCRNSGTALEWSLKM